MKSVHSPRFPLIALPASLGTLAAQSPGNVQVTADIVYSTYGTRQLKLAIYRPPSTKPLPGIVVIRGGGWRRGDKQGFASIARNVAAKGFVTACIEYRALPEVQFPDPVYDTKAAVRWMRAEGPRYGVATDSIEGDGGHAGVSSRVQAVVALAPVTDFAAMSRTGAAGSNIVQVLFQNKIEVANSFSPVTYLKKDSAPILFIHGDADKTVFTAQSEEMLERCKKADVRASLITLKGVPHAFWNQPKWAADTITQAAAFFHDVLGH